MRSAIVPSSANRRRTSRVFAFFALIALAGGLQAARADEKADLKLLDAASSGEIEDVRGALRDGADINVQDKWGRTALHKALFHHHQKLAVYLVEQGADLTLKEEEHGATPLHLAGMMGLKDVTRLMAKKGADPFSKTTNGWIPQHWAGVFDGCCEDGLLKEYGWEHVMTAHEEHTHEKLLDEVKARAKAKDFACSCWCDADAGHEWRKAGCCGEARITTTSEREPLGRDEDCLTGACSWTPFGAAGAGPFAGACFSSPPAWDWTSPYPSPGLMTDGYRTKGTTWYDAPWWYPGGCTATPGAPYRGACYGSRTVEPGTLRSGMQPAPHSQYPYWERAGASPCGLSEPPHDPSRRNLSCELYPSELSDEWTVRTQCCSYRDDAGKLHRRVRVWHTHPHSHKDANGKTFTHTHPHYHVVDVLIDE